MFPSFSITTKFDNYIEEMKKEYREKIYAVDWAKPDDIFEWTYSSTSVAKKPNSVDIIDTVKEAMEELRKKDDLVIDVFKILKSVPLDELTKGNYYQLVRREREIDTTYPKQYTKNMTTIYKYYEVEVSNVNFLALTPGLGQSVKSKYEWAWFEDLTTGEEFSMPIYELEETWAVRYVS